MSFCTSELPEKHVPSVEASPLFHFLEKMFVSCLLAVTLFTKLATNIVLYVLKLCLPCCCSAEALLRMETRD